MIRRLLTVCLLLASAGASVTVRAKLTDGTGTVSRTAFLRFQLQNCGPNTPADPTLGVATIQTQFDLRPNQPDGSILYGNLISNDDILCGGVASTYYVITPMKDQLHPLRDGLPFVLHNGDTFDPSVTQPMVTFPPAPPQSPLCCGAANTPPPPTPPTTCGILPGTTNEIVKYINGPCGRLGDSSGTDDGTHPTRWPNGITVGNGGYYRELANNASPGTGLNLLVERDSSGAAQLASLSSQKVIGIAGYGAGTVGSVQVLLIGYSPLVCDGQTVLGDYFIASPTVPGECNDVGTSLIPGVLGVITSINSGADSLGRVEYFPSNGTSSGASGTVGPCNSLNIPGPIGYFTAIQKVDCDDSFTTDGAGNAALQSAAFYGLFDGFTYYTPLGGPPPFLAASSVYVVPPPAIAATYGLQLPVEGSGCLEGTDGINSNGDPNVSLAFTGLPCGTSSLSFSALTSGTNGTAAMLVGTGASLFTTGTGQNRASSVGFPTAAQTGPGTVSETNCSGVGNAFAWTQLADGTYAQQAAIDLTTTMPNVSGPLGTLVHCRREWWNDTNSVPQSFKNAMVGFWHKNSFGVDTTSNDNRTVAVGMTLDNSYAASANSSAQAWYTEVDMTGAPQLGRAVITPLDESVDVLAGVVGDTRSGKTGATNGPSVGVRGANFFNGSFNQPWQSCQFCNFGTVGLAGNASTQNLTAQGYYAVGVFGYCRGDLGGGAGSEQCYGVYGQVAGTQNDTTGAVVASSDAAGNDFYATRYTDSSPTGLFLRLKASATNTTIYSVDKSGNSTGVKFSTASGPVSGNWNCTNVTPVTVNTSTTSDQNLMACTIPAGTLNSVGKTLRVYAAGIYSTPAASTSQMTLKVKLCTVSGCASGMVITPINIQSTALGTIQVTNDNFSLHSDITTQTAGASSAYEAHGDLLIDLSTLTTAADSAFGDTNTATVGTIDSTAQLFFQVTGAFSAASGSNSFTERQLVIDSVN